MQRPGEQDRPRQNKTRPRPFVVLVLFPFGRYCKSNYFAPFPPVQLWKYPQRASERHTYRPICVVQRFKNVGWGTCKKLCRSDWAFKRFCRSGWSQNNFCRSDSICRSKHKPWQGGFGIEGMFVLNYSFGCSELWNNFTRPHGLRRHIFFQPSKQAEAQFSMAAMKQKEAGGEALACHLCSVIPLKWSLLMLTRLVW